MYERGITGQLTTGKKSILLLGARQTGKSTLLHKLQPDLVRNLASPATFRELVSQPQQLEQELRAVPSSVRTILIDEVQRVPELLNAVQVLIDEFPDRFRFLLSGSSARKLRRGHANLLPGRIHTHALHPLVATELGHAFDVERAMAHGTLPGIYATEDEKERSLTLSSYVDTYLREEIQAEALVRDVGGYARLLDLVATYSGKILNTHRISEDAGIPYETGRRYLSVLEDTLLLLTVPSWTGPHLTAQAKNLIRHPKAFIFDAGVRNVLLKRSLTKVLPDERGILFEHLVAYEIYRRLGRTLEQASFAFYRTKHGTEVDFILSVQDRLWAIEAKSGTQISSSDVRGIRAFQAEEPNAFGIVVFTGTARRRVAENILAIPLEEFSVFLEAGATDLEAR